MNIDYNTLLHYMLLLLYFVNFDWFFMDWEISEDEFSDDIEDKSVLEVSEFHLACTE